MVKVDLDKKYLNSRGVLQDGYFIDSILKSNLDFLKAQIKSKFDGIFAITGNEGCQPKGSWVMLASGHFKQIELLKERDYILSPQANGCIKKAQIKKTVKWISKEIYEVYSSNNKLLYSCSYNHIIPIYDKEKEIWVDYNVEQLFEKYSKQKMFICGKIKDWGIEKEKCYVKRKGVSEEVYGFEIDSESGWYITDNYMITHNTGKSTLAQMVAHYLDPTLNQENVVFSGEDLMKRIDECKKGECIIYDEAVTDLSTQDHASDIQKIIIKKFTMIRSKGLYIILILPNPFMLRRYFFIFRTKFLLHTYSVTGLDRGYFKFYSYRQKKLMYLRGYKEWNMDVVRPNFVGRFTNTEGFFLDADNYEKCKQTAIAKLTEEKNTKGAQLEEKFKDRKLKLEIDFKMAKEKMKERVEQKFADLKKQMATLKTTNVKLLEEEHARLMLYAYQQYKEYNEKFSRPTDETIFIKDIKKMNVAMFNTTETRLRKLLSDGREYQTLDMRNR